MRMVQAERFPFSHLTGSIGLVLFGKMSFVVPSLKVQVQWMRGTDATNPLSSWGATLCLPGFLSWPGQFLFTWLSLFEPLPRASYNIVCWIGLPGLMRLLLLINKIFTHRWDKLLFSKNLSRDVRRSISSSFGFSTTNDLGILLSYYSWKSD